MLQNKIKLIKFASTIEAIEAMHTTLTVFKYSAILWVVLSTMMCTHRETSPKATAVIDDSLSVHSPSVRSMIEKHMSLSDDSMEYYDYAVRLGKWYLGSSTPDSALPWINRSADFASRHEGQRAKQLLAYALNARSAYLHYYHTHTAQSIQLYTQAYNLLMECEDKKQAPDVCANLGDAYVYEDRLPEAASWYRRALVLADSLKLPQRKVLSLYMGLGRIYQHLGDYDQALSLYQTTDKYFEQMPTSMQSFFLNNYGNFYYYRKDYRQSLKVFTRLERFLKDKGMADNFDMYLCRTNLADVNLNLGHVEAAEELLDLVSPFWEKVGDSTALYYCNTIRLGIAISKKDMKAAEAIIMRETPGQKVEYDMLGIRNAYKRRYFEMQGQWHKAYMNLMADEAVRDSLTNSRMNMRASDIMSQYAQDTLRLHNSLAMEKKNAEVKTSHLWLALAVALVIVLLLLLLLVVRRSRQRKTAFMLQAMRLKLHASRGQISPHFIFNVINNQISSSNAAGADRLLQLTRLIRANLDMTGQMTVTIEQELDFVRKYVDVERELLLDNDFDFQIKVDDSIDITKVRIPSMMVQIMVENAFVHGFMGRSGHKELVIEVARSHGGLTLAVKDNGPGFDARAMTMGTRKGLSIIRQTLAVVNANNHHKMTFDIHNVQGKDGENTGCVSLVFIPEGMKYPE